jgi:Domain of unknown function (DUF4185)
VPRRRAGSALLALGTLLLAATGCVTEPQPSHPELTYRLTPACPHPPPSQTVTADQLNTMVAHGDLPAWQAGDIGASARLSDGRLVWAFADTVRTSQYDPPLVANSLLLSSGRCVSQLMTSADGPVIPDATQEVVRWPMSVAVLRHDPEAPPGTDVLVVLCARTQRGTGSNLDFTFRGTSAAVFTVPPLGTPHLETVYEVTPDDPDPQQVNWGSAAMVAGDWFYVYGTRLPKGALGHALYVARAPVADPRDRSRWQFWDGHRWQSHRQQAAPVLGSHPGVSQTLSVDDVHGRYVVTSKRGGDLADFVYTWASTAPTGPWTPHEALNAPAGFDTGHYEYAPLAHPEIPVAKGHLLVSVSRNTADPQELLAHPVQGRPLFAEVAFPR